MITSELLPGLTLIVLLGLISGRSTGTRLAADLVVQRKICVTIWSPPRGGAPPRHGAALQLGVGLGHDLEQAAGVDHREARSRSAARNWLIGHVRRHRPVGAQC